MLRLATLFLGFVWVPLCQAANLSISASAKDPSIADPAYPGTGSTITSSFDKQTQVTVSIGGRNYGTLPLIGPRVGLKAGPLPGQSNKDGFAITGGFQPTAAGSKVTILGADASYISVSLANVQPNTLIQNFSIEFQGLTLTSNVNAWGAASPGGFANWAVPSYNANSGKLTLDLADFTSTGSGPVEIRLYGLIAVGQGSFTDVKLSATLVAPVPEPGTALLLGLGLVLNFRFRRHRSRDAVKTNVS